MNFILSLYKEAFSNLNRNIWILAIAMFINRSGSIVLLFTSLYLTNEFHFTIIDAGFIMSFYGIGSVLGSYIGGWLTDRKNHFDIMIFSLVVSGCILLLLLVATSLTAIATVIFFYALTADIFRPANSAAIANYTNETDRTRSVSLMRLAINLGFSVGPAIGGFVALYLGYHFLFVLDACTSFAAAIMMYRFLPRKKSELNRHKNDVLSDNKTSAYRDFKYLLFILLVALYGLCFFQLFASMPQYFNKICHYNADTIGLLLALNGLLVVIIEMPLVTVLEKKKKRFHFIIVGVICLPISFATLLFGKGLMLMAIIYTLFMTLSEAFAMPFMFNYAISRPKKERQGQYSALYSISYGLANIAAPVIGLTIAAKYGFNNMFIFFIVLSILIVIGFSLLSRKQEQ